MRIVLFSLILLFVVTLSLFPENNDQVILILPFINTGKENKIINETIFVSYFYLYFEQLKSFRAIHPHQIFNYMKKYTYNIVDLYTIEVLNELANRFSCDFILGGEYKIENNILKINIDILGKQRKIIIKKNFEIDIDKNERKALSDVVQQSAKAFSGYDPDTASLIVNTEYPCLLYLNDAFLGITSKRFTIPAGEYKIKIVYKDDYFNAVVFEKQVRLEKGQIYDLGEIQTIVTYELTSNVEAGIYYNGKRIGVTDLMLQLPVGNEFDIEIVYTDAQNERRYKKEHIITNDGKDDAKYYEFSNRIKVLNGSIPLSARIGDSELITLPHTFDNLETGTHRVQVVLEDQEWNREWVIHEVKVTLNIAETAIIDKSNFVYRKNWALCFVPGMAQFRNFEKTKGTILMVFAVTSLIESVIMGYFMIDYYNSTYLPAKHNYQNENINFSRIQSKQQILSIATITGISVFGIVFTYSCIDGIITMKHLNELL